MPIINKLKKIKGRIRKFFGIRLIKSIRDLIIFQQNHEFQQKHPNPLNSYGKKCFSQNDEDGAIEAIFDKIGTKDKIYIEFGVEDCTECNTRYLRSVRKDFLCT